jgi:hypothetical protein
MTNEEREAHIKSCGVLMENAMRRWCETGDFSYRGEADRWKLADGGGHQGAALTAVAWPGWNVREDLEWPVTGSRCRVNLPDKPEVWQMAGMLGVEADSVVGKLLRVWAWFDAHTEDGNAVGVTYPLVDRVAGVARFRGGDGVCVGG